MGLSIASLINMSPAESQRYYRNRALDLLTPSPQYHGCKILHSASAYLLRLQPLRGYHLPTSHSTRIVDWLHCSEALVSLVCPLPFRQGH